MNAARDAMKDGWSEDSVVIAPLGDGHIHDTFLVTGPGTGTGQRRVLQRINQAVFTDPARVMANLALVVDQVDSVEPGMIAPLLPTRTGEAAWVDARDDWWRLWQYVEGRSLDAVADTALARAAGLAFGRFQRVLAGLADADLPPTIPGFLELDGYLAAFDEVQVSREGVRDRSQQVETLIAFVAPRRALADRFPPAGELIHGDCKLNNLLFAPDAPRVTCVLDLDTVMVGHWAWDFGDLARSVVMGQIRSEADNPVTDGDLFRALVAGFSVGRGEIAAPEDLVDAPVYIAFMLGVRFLTDHLSGDHYFRVSIRGENLARAAEQFELVSRFEADRQVLLRAAESGLDNR